MIFSGGYLYFYQNEKEFQYQFYIFIKNSQLSLIADQSSTILIKNRYNECVIQF